MKYVVIDVHGVVAGFYDKEVALTCALIWDETLPSDAPHVVYKRLKAAK